MCYHAFLILDPLGKTAVYKLIILNLLYQLGKITVIGYWFSTFQHPKGVKAFRENSHLIPNWY